MHWVELCLLHHPCRAHLVLLHSVVRSKGEDGCLWSIVGQSTYSLNCRNRLRGDVLRSDIPRPGFTFAFLISVSIMMKTAATRRFRLTHQNAVVCDHSSTTPSNLGQALHCHPFSIYVWFWAPQQSEASQRSTPLNLHPTFESPAYPTSAWMTRHAIRG